MQTGINFLSKASDFAILSKTEFHYSFNKFRGGEFTDADIPETVFAYGTEWALERKWIDRAWGDYCYVYNPKGSFKLPQKVLIESKSSNMPGWQDCTQKLYWYGELILELCDNWGRAPFEDISKMQEQLESCVSKEGCLKMVEKLSKEAYYQKKKAELLDEGLNDDEVVKYFKTKTQLKREGIKFLPLVRSQKYPKALFEELSNAQSHGQFQSVCQYWGKLLKFSPADILEQFEATSLPRKTAYCQFLAHMS